MENEIVHYQGRADHVQGRGRGARGGVGRRAGDRATSVPMQRMRETRWAGRSGRHPASDASGPSAPLRMEGRVPTPSVMSTKTAKGPTVNRKMCSRPILESAALLTCLRAPSSPSFRCAVKDNTGHHHGWGILPVSARTPRAGGRAARRGVFTAADPRELPRQKSRTSQTLARPTGRRRRRRAVDVAKRTSPADLSVSSLSIHSLYVRGIILGYKR